MIIELSKKFYELAKTVDFSDLEGYIDFSDDRCEIIIEECKIRKEDYFGKEFLRDSVYAFLDCIATEIDLTGLSEDQEKILPRGKELYELHDSILCSLA